MKCPIHGIEKVLKIVDDESIKESFPVYDCHLCKKELMFDLKAFQSKVANGYDRHDVERLRAS